MTHNLVQTFIQLSIAIFTTLPVVYAKHHSRRGDPQGTGEIRGQKSADNDNWPVTYTSLTGKSRNRDANQREYLFNIFVNYYCYEFLRGMFIFRKYM